MKTEQIKLVLAISREKFISKAADTLFISQPTASNILKVLENELGYPIFQRTKSGMIPTEEGIEFIEYAEVIERLLNAISRIRKQQKIDIRIISLRNDFSELAFEQFCNKYLTADYAVDLSFQTTGSTEEAFRILERGMGDIAIAACRKKLYESTARHAAKNHFEIAKLK